MELLFVTALLLVLLVLNVPIAFALLGTSAVGLFLFQGGISGLYQMPLQSYSIGREFVLVAIPLFVLMAQVLSAGGVGRDLFDIASKWLRHLPGGLGIATIGATAIFSAISGAAVAAAATMSLVAIPEMLKRGYPKRLTLGLVAVAAGLDILIPPSIPLILYGALTDESVGRLYIGGLGPGLLWAALYAGYLVYLAMRGKIQIVEQPATWRERFEATKNGFWGLFIPVLVIGGIYTGFFTPTEAAAVGVVLAFAVVLLVYRTQSFRNLVTVTMDALKGSLMLYAVIIGATVLGYLLNILHVPQDVTAWVASLNAHPIVVIYVISILLIILGMFLDVASIILITVPILYPVVTSLGFDGIWFGVLLVANMNMAVVTPPVGLCLYVVQGVTKEPLDEVVRGVMPFYVLQLLGLILMIHVPQIILFLPGLLGPR
jgi:C4-dicarboxylate transporter DctM subunit